jgi:hypothetical protein
MRTITASDFSFERNTDCILLYYAVYHITHLSYYSLLAATDLLLLLWTFLSSTCVDMHKWYITIHSPVFCYKRQEDKWIGLVIIKLHISSKLTDLNNKTKLTCNYIRRTGEVYDMYYLPNMVINSRINRQEIPEALAYLWKWEMSVFYSKISGEKATYKT